jgi:hypothetical protein
MKPLKEVKDALDTKENFQNLRKRIDESCEKISVKANILSFSE